MGKTKHYKPRPWVKAGRAEEVIGGGYFVFRRGQDTGRIRPAFWSFEHPTLALAIAAAKKLSDENPGQQFDVFGLLDTAFIPTAAAVEIKVPELA